MFKDRLRELREREGLTQKELGEKVFVSRSAVCKWEMGNGIPSDVNLQTLCEFFNVEEDWLLDRQDLKATVYQYQRKFRNRMDFVVGLVVPIVLFVFSTMGIFRFGHPGEMNAAVHFPFRSIFYYLKRWSAIPLLIWISTGVFFVLQIRPTTSAKRAKLYFKIDLVLLFLCLVVFVTGFSVANSMANKENFWFYLLSR